MKSFHSFLQMDFPSSNVSSGMFYFLHGKRIYIAEPLPTLEDLEEFRKLHGNYCLNPIFVRKAIVQTVQKDIEAGGIEGIRFLFRCFQGHEGTYRNTNNEQLYFLRSSWF